jgi:elongator complex protein 3
MKIKKPIRTISGVTPLTVVLKPFPCPHGRCTYCPREKGVPNSYTTKSPAIMRAMTFDYDSYKQVESRLEAFKNMGHPTSKVEVIVIGGTFLAYPKEYQYEFIKNIYDALNQKKSKSLEEAKKINEKTKNRCVALCIETRPDWCGKEQINRLLDFGCTRVELGVQMPDNKIYKKVKRGHTVKDVIIATKLLKDSGFKVGYHIMPGLPGSNLKKDLKLFKKVFSNSNFKPDQLKIYPLQVIENTPLEKDYLSGKFKVYKENQTTDLLCKMKSIVPPYCRIMRIIRQFASSSVTSGDIKSSSRNSLTKRMKELGLKCKCIRCREIGFSKRDETPKLKIKKYKASKGKEFFISFESKHCLFGLCRARIPYQPFRKEITKRSLIIRELHVYGKEVQINSEGKETQHKGLGKKLMLKAEKIAKKNKCNKIVVISGVGVRRYYIDKLGYEQEGNYVCKII